MITLLMHELYTGSNCTDNDIRLVGSGLESQGRLDVCINGVWGSVCDDGWTDVNAIVVCRQLGYEANGIATQ